MSEIDTSPEAARSMGVTAVSAIVDEFGLEKRALRLHFDHDVTDQDRADLLAAINLWQSRSSLAADRDRFAAKLAAAEQARASAIVRMSGAHRLRGEAEGKLAASEMAGVVEGWKRRAEQAEAKLAEAERERDEECEHSLNEKRETDRWIQLHSDACDDRDRLAAENARLREALEPFAKAATIVPVSKRENSDGDDFILWSFTSTHGGEDTRATITMPHLRGAYAALTKAEG